MKTKSLLALALLAGLLYFMAFHWGRFLADFWPLDNSRVGPNLTAAVVQYAVILALLYLLYPPFRRAVERFAARHVESIKAHISAEHDHVHAKLDHVIRYSKNIPNEVPGVPRHRKVKL